MIMGNHPIMSTFVSLRFGVLESVWVQEEASAKKDGNDDGVCCQLCAHFPEHISVWHLSLEHVHILYETA